MKFQSLRSTETSPSGIYEWAKRLVEDLNKSQTASPPIGAIEFWSSGVDLPLGWIAADGSTFNRDDYPKLFLLLSGTGTTFDTPNITAPSGAVSIIRAA